MKKYICLLLSICLICGFVSFSSAEFSGIFGVEKEDAEDTENDLGLFLQFLDSEDDDEDSDEDDALALTPNYAVTGSTVWQIVDRTILCTRIPEGTTVAVLALESSGEPLFDGVISFTGDSVLYCAAWLDETGAAKVMLEKLALQGEQIVSLGRTDCSEALGAFFDPENGWLEADIAPCAGGIFLMALDAEFQFNLYRLNLENMELKALGVISMMFVTAAVPYGEQMLLAGFSTEEESAVDLTALSPEDGTQQILATVLTGSSSQALNYAYAPDQNLICFTIDQIAYRVALDGNLEAEAFCILEEMPAPGRLALIVQDYYVLQDESGSLFWVKLSQTIEAQRLKVQNITGEETLGEIVTDYNLEHPESFISVMEGGIESQLLDEMLNQSADKDLYTVNTAIGIFDSLRTRGYLGDFHPDRELLASAGEMYPVVREKILDGEQLLMIPMSVENACLTLNPAALSGLTGVPGAELPHDWPGFLRLLAQIAEEGSMEDNDLYMAGEAGMTAMDFQELIFSWILRDAFLWNTRTNATNAELEQALLPALRAFEQVDWTRLGLAEDEEMDFSWVMSESREMLISEMALEIGPVMMEPGMVYWPLAIREGEDPLIPQTISGLILNPYSTQQELARSLAKTVWENVDILTKMSLSPDMNDPVVNTAYQEDVAYLEALVPMYDEAIAEAEDSTEAEMLRAEKAEMEEFLSSYRENAYWAASAESIAQYRSWAAYFVPAQPEFWSADTEDAAVLQYLDGMISAEQFVQQLISALNMARLEGN